MACVGRRAAPPRAAAPPLRAAAGVAGPAGAARPAAVALGRRLAPGGPPRAPLRTACLPAALVAIAARPAVARAAGRAAGAAAAPRRRRPARGAVPRAGPAAPPPASAAPPARAAPAAAALPEGRSSRLTNCGPPRRCALAPAVAAIATGAPACNVAADSGALAGGLREVSDPETYPALVYAPSGSRGKLPLLLVLHGAGRNDRGVRDLADPAGEHRGLAPSLLASGAAPRELSDNFAVVAPYAAGKASFYEEPRQRLVRFVQWVCSDAGRAAGCPDVDPKRVFLFGFSDGATVGVELATTGRFAGGVFAAYGFTGTLPALALARLKDLPIWVFHAADDVIFPVSCSDKLVEALRRIGSRDVVRYTRYDRDQEGFTGSVRGHSTGITASRQAEVYSWLRSL